MILHFINLICGDRGLRRGLRGYSLYQRSKFEFYLEHTYQILFDHHFSKDNDKSQSIFAMKTFSNMILSGSQLKTEDSFSVSIDICRRGHHVSEMID